MGEEIKRSFRDDVQMYLRVSEEKGIIGIYGLALDRVAPNGDKSAASFWLADNELMAFVIVSEQGITPEVMERAIAIADSEEEAVQSDAKGFSTAVIAIPGDHSQSDDPELPGYEIWWLFGYPLFSLFGVAHSTEKPLN